MIKRQLILNEYKTAEDGLWTLAACKITKASQVQNFMDVPGRYAPLDLSTALTDGQPYYGSAGLDARLESSEGTRAERQARIDQLVNLLDGEQVRIVHPDHPNSYHIGRVQVVPEYNDLAHCAVSLSAVLEPWRYNNTETVKQASLPSTETSENLLDIPDITVSGSHPYSNLLVGDFELPAGEYTFSAKYKHEGGLNGQISIREYGSLDKYLDTALLYAGKNGKAAITFTVPEGVQGIRIYLYSNITASAGDTSVTLSNIMVNEGPTAFEYVPYYTAGDQALTLSNEGKLAVLPTVRVTGESVALTWGGQTKSLSAGTYQLPDLYLTPGKHYVVCSGKGTVTFTYREAVLAV